MTKNEILSHFECVKKVSDNQYSARCPAHDDKTPSLSINANVDRVSLHCFAGCSQEDVLRGVGLKKEDLFTGKKTAEKRVIKETAFHYHEVSGTVSYIKIRRDYDDGTKGFEFRLPNGKVGLNGKPHLLYNLPNLKNADRIIVVEGEKCADSVIKQGYSATTLDCGAKSKWQTEYLKHFKGKEVWIVPDNDSAGMDYAVMLKSHITWAQIKPLSDLKEKGDIFDWLNSGHKVEELEDVPEYVPPSEDKPDDKTEKKKQSQLMLSSFDSQQVQLLLDENHDVYVKVKVENHFEVYSAYSKDFNLWAQRCYYNEYGATVRDDALRQSVNELVAEAKFGGAPTIKLYNRVARDSDSIWYDLTDKNWRSIEVSKGSWKVVEISPTLFKRYRHQEPQVIPIAGGDLNKIFDYVRIDNYKLLFLCWLVSCFVPEIPHPVTIVYGEKGAAKSTMCTLIKKLIDPSVMDTLSLRKDERALLVNLQNHYYLPFDNVSSISAETSDTLCRAVTGGAIQQRKLHTDADDYIFNFRRCLTINGINNVVDRADLLDRSIMIEVLRVNEDMRRELQEVLDSFEKDRPIILGAIFDVLAKAKEIYPKVKLDKLPRMADFCRWGYAIAEAIEDGNGNLFLDEYKSNRKKQNEEAINADAVAYLIVDLMQDRGRWEDRVSKLLVELKLLAETNGISGNAKVLPQSPSHLTRRLKAAKSNLESVGIEFSFRDCDRGRIVTLKNNNIRILAPVAPYHVDVSNVIGDISGIDVENGDNGGKSVIEDNFDENIEF